MPLRSDLFSVGVMFYHLITGEKPFMGKQPSTIMLNVISKEPAPPSDLNLDINDALDFVILKALAKKKHVRFQTAAEFATAIKNVQNGKPNDIHVASDSQDATCINDDSTCFDNDLARPNTQMDAANQRNTVNHKNITSHQTSASDNYSKKNATPIFQNIFYALSTVILLVFVGFGIWHFSPEILEQLEITKSNSSATPPVDSIEVKDIEAPPSDTKTEVIANVDNAANATTTANLIYANNAKEHGENGIFAIESEPQQLAVVLNTGEKLGITPMNLALIPGQYHLSFNKNGYYPIEVEIIVEKNKNVPLFITLLQK